MGASEELMPILGILINIVVGVVLSVASTLLQQAFAPKPQQQQAQQRGTGTRGTTQFGGKVPQYFLVGTVGDAGKREYPRKQWGNSGEVPHAYNVDVISFGDLPITAMTKLYIGSVVEPVSGSGHVEQGYPTTGDKADVAWIEFFDGSQTTANAYLQSKFGSDPDHPWSSDMIGRGIPYLTLTSLWTEGKWAGFPEIVGEFQGIPLYDPRKDDTAGGEGDHRWDDPSTWEFSDNNIVIAYNIERGIHYNEAGATELGPHIWGGTATEAQLPHDVWAAAMDACDIDIALAGGGTEKQFRAGRRISLNERPADVVKELMIGANARHCHAADGTVYVLVGVPDVGDGSFTDDDVLASEPLGSIPFPNLDDVINGATASYREPMQAWEDKDTAPYYRSDLEDEDDGRRQVQALDLGTTFSGTQAQRILKAVIEEGRRFRRHVVALPPEYASYRPLSVLAWTSERFGYEGKLFLVTARTVDPWGTVVLGLQEIDPADHGWTPEVDERPLSFAPVTVNRPPSQPMSGFAVSPYVFPRADGSAARPGILLEYTGKMPDIRAVAYRVREDFGDGNIVAVGEILYDTENENAAQPNGGQWTLSDTDYEVDAKFLPYSDRVTNWASEDNGGEWLAVTTPEVGIKLADLDASTKALLNQLGQVRTLIEQFKQIGTLLEGIDRERFHEHNSLARSVEVRLGDLSASFNEIIEVALGPGGAIATALESLYAAMGGNTAEVNIRWQAVATEPGFAASYAIQAAVNDGSFRAATFIMNVPINPAEPTEIVLAAGRTKFATSGGDTIALVDEDGFLRSANGSVEINLITGEFSFGV